MSNDLNQCSFIGRLGADPESRFMTSGDPVCNFRIAVGWKGKDKEGVEWVSCVAFSKLGEICGQYLKKGSQVFVQGRFKTEKFVDKDGHEKYSTKIILDTMQMLGKKESGDRGDDGDYAPAPRKDKPKADDDLGSDVPF